MNLAADIDVHLQEHGTDALFTSAALVSKKLRVVFSPESYAEGEVLGAAAATRVTLAVAKSADLGSADNRCKLKVGTVTYNVVDARAYGDGWTIITLSLD